MKKRLLCLLLILIVAFSFAACDIAENTGPATGNADPGPSNGTHKSDYVAPDLGEKGYVDHVFSGLGNQPNDTTSCKVIISSMDELQEFRSSTQMPSIGTNGLGINNPERISISERLDMYASEYFEEAAIVVLLWRAPSGQYDYTVKDVEIEENTLNVTLQCWKYLIGHQAVVQWGAVIELEKSDVDTLNVATETIQQRTRASGVELHLCLTHEVAIETIYHDFTPKDFPELNFDFTIEDAYPDNREKIKHLLINAPTDNFNREYLNNYTRVLVITLTVESQENVLRAVELLSQRADVKWAEAEWEYYFPID